MMGVLVRRAIMLFLLIAAATGLNGERTSYYQDVPLDNNPGIYYEYMGEVKIIRTQWKIAVSLDMSGLEDPIPWREKQLYKTLRTCKEQLALTECDKILPLDRLHLNMGLLRSLEEDIHMFMAPAMSALVPKDQPNVHALKKRGAPLEFVGWATRTLFGNMDAADRERINDEMDKLYERTSNISMLASQQTHIVRSNLEEMHKELAKDQQRMREAHEVMIKAFNRTTYMDRFINQTRVVQAVSMWAYQFEQSLEYTISSYKTIVNTIETASQGHLHPLLFTQSQLQTILKTINGYSLPWEHERVKLETLHALAQTHVSTRKGRLVVTLEFPLTDNVRYKHHKLHSLPIPKDLVGNKTSYAEIIPSYGYLIVSHDMRQYLLAGRDYIDACRKYMGVMLCQPTLPIFTDHENSPCEFTLLARPSQRTIRTCKLSLTTNRGPTWTKLATTDEWLYSTAAAVPVRIVCNNEGKAEVIVKGTGILAIQGQCTGHTSHNMLYGVNTIQFNQTSIYKPELTLNLPHLDLTESDLEGNEVSSSYTYEDRAEVQAWAEGEDAITLQQIEDKFKEIARQRKERFNTIMYTSTAASCPVIIIVLAFLLSRYLPKGVGCYRKNGCEQKSTPSEVQNPTRVSLELTAAQPLMEREVRRVYNHQRDSGEFLPREETTFTVPRQSALSCREITLYGSPVTVAEDRVREDDGRARSVSTLCSGVRPLPIQGAHVV